MNASTSDKQSACLTRLNAMFYEIVLPTEIDLKMFPKITTFEF